MSKFDYNEKAIINLINANTKLVDDRKYMEIKLNNKIQMLKDIKSYLKFLLKEGKEEIKVKKIVELIKELEDEEDIHNFLY